MIWLQHKFLFVAIENTNLNLTQLQQIFTQYFVETYLLVCIIIQVYKLNNVEKCYFGLVRTISVCFLLFSVVFCVPANIVLTVFL